MTTDFKDRLFVWEMQRENAAAMLRTWLARLQSLGAPEAIADQSSGRFVVLAVLGGRATVHFAPDLAVLDSEVQAFRLRATKSGVADVDVDTFVLPEAAAAIQEMCSAPPAAR